jgi:2-oxoglutarate ferredoxin oxidoreductase subunit alpha
MDRASVEIHGKELSEGAPIIVDEAFNLSGGNYLVVPYEKLGEKRYENVIAFGVICVLLGIGQDVAAAAIDAAFGKKDAEVSEKNRRALDASFDWAKQQKISFPKLPPVAEAGRRLMMNGNDAVALGALAAGVRLCSFYPMTPSTSIAQSLAEWGIDAGVVVEQAEDEIAAINMAVGASFTGAPAIVPTSGGGFALMVEGVALAGMTETPVVIVVGQRPGPATGLPTRTEQGELMFVIHAGHGEFPKAVFAPGTVEECFSVTKKAFGVAARYQGPVFILTDQFIADSYRAVEPFDLDVVGEGEGGVDQDAGQTPYRRYAFTESGLSPRLLPGATKHLVVADSDEHSEDGHITEDHGVRITMVEKRLKKLEGIKKEVIPPEFTGDGASPDLLLVSWGSTKGAAMEAAEWLREKGKKVGCLHFSQVWPLIPEQFIDLLTGAKETVCIESNATGQFASLVRRETGHVMSKKVLRYDGLPLTASSIVKGIVG